MEFDDSININHLLEFGVGISLICNFLVFSDDKLSDDKQQESISECQAFNSKVVGNGGRNFSGPGPTIGKDVDMGVSNNNGTPQIIKFNRDFC